MKKDNLSKLVKYAKEVITLTDVVEVCNERYFSIERSLLEKLSQSESFDDLLAIAKYAKCPTDILKKILIKSDMLNREENIEMKCAIAKNANCDEEIFQKLLKVHNENIDISVAENAKVNSKFLNRLASKKKSEEVRCAVADNPNCTEAIMQKLLENATYDIKNIIAHNRKTPISILEQLYNDEDIYIAYNAAKRLYGGVSKLCERILYSELEDDMRFLAYATDSVDVLRTLCQSENHEVMHNAISNRYSYNRLQGKFEIVKLLIIRDLREII